MEIRQALVQAVCAGMRGGQIAWPAETLSRQDWEELCLLARQQQVLPVLVHSCYASPAFLSQDEAFRREVLGSNRMQVARQTMRSAALGALWTQLCQAGFTPVIMKGAACRTVWPLGSVRLSSDEDVLVPHDQFSACVDFLRGQGFACGDVDGDASEVGLRRGDGLYLELHRSPFAPDDPVLGGCALWFEDIYQRCITVEADGAALQVMGPDDHMLLLILHAFKHLLHSGFGLRQVCDLVLWAESYGADINWATILERCSAVRAVGFARAVFGIGAKYLGMDTQKACLPEELLGRDEEMTDALLHDLLTGGVFGTASRSRHHSATVTHNAVAADRAGEKSSLLQSLFPPSRQLEGQYPYLKKAPWLVPAAWATRLVRYGGEVLRREDSDAAETLRIGRERTELLRKLDIMD